MYPSPGSVHCGSCVSLGGPGVPDRVSPGPVSFPIARAVTVSVRLCLARFLLFLLCAFIYVLFAPACLVRPPKPCRAIRVSGACRACRLARQPEIGHPFIPTLATAPSSAPRPARFWRDAAVLARCQTFCGIGRRTTDAPPGQGAANVPFPGTREAFWAVFAPCVPDFGTLGALDFPRSGPRAPHRQDAGRLTRARGCTGRRRGAARDKKS